MSENSCTIDATPDQVFEVLLDGANYARWVVGAKEIRGVDPDWPRTGSELHHTVGVGPFNVRDTTKLLAEERPRFVRLEVHVGVAATGIVEFHLSEETPGRTKVTMIEEPIEGMAKVVDGAAEKALLGIRNEATLRELKTVVEERYGRP